MIRSRLGLAAAVLLAVVLQPTVVARLPLPGRPPDLVLVLVLAVGLAGGPAAGMAWGLAAGLLTDLRADTELGRLALVHVVAGYLAGRAGAPEEAGGSPLRPFLVVGLGAAGALLLASVQGLLLDDPRVSLAALSQALATSVPYALALTPVVVPGVARLVPRRAAAGERL